MTSDIRQIYLLDFGNKIGYIGCAIDPYKRYYQHLTGQSRVEQMVDWINNMNPKLPQLIILDSFDNAQLIELTGPRPNRIKLEQMYMWDLIGKGWILLNKNLWAWPIEYTKEVREKISKGQTGNQNAKGCIFSKERRRKISIALMDNQNGRGNRGKEISEETRTKISNALTGYKHSEEARLNMSNRPGSFLGHKHSEKSKRKMSESIKNLKIPKEIYAAIGRVGSCNRWHSNRPRVSDSKLCQECFDKQEEN